MPRRKPPENPTNKASNPMVKRPVEMRKGITCCHDLEKSQNFRKK
jgi:hypothetical protein